MRISQLCARIEFGDAVSNHVLEIDKALRSWGHETAVYANTLDEFGRQVALPDSAYSERMGSEDDLLIYHYSLHCPNYKQYLETKNKRILIYHNITPPEFFEGYDKGVAEFCRQGRDMLAGLKGCDLALGDSEFNRLELVDAGFDESKTGVLPIFVDYEKLLSLKGRAKVEADTGDLNVIFVGRAVPNKRIEDLVRAFYYLNRCVTSSSRLILVGSSWVDRYDAQIRWLIDSFGLFDRVTVTGRVTDAELAAYYDAADVFLSMSEHEGFSVPLVECMAFDVPIVAYRSTAIPYTLQGAGLMFDAKDFAGVGELLALVRDDPELRDRVLAGQRERLKAFSPESVRAVLKQAVERVAGS